MIENVHIFSAIKTAIDNNTQLSITKYDRNYNYVWISFINAYCSTTDCHYELCWDRKQDHDGKHIYAEIHFETEKGRTIFKKQSFKNPLKTFKRGTKNFGVCLDDNDIIISDTADINDLANVAITKIINLYDNSYLVLRNMQKTYQFINLLEENKNIILHGAPGTGKTYLAHQIADTMMAAKVGFVQFHPSFDYTDFVEGLRPVSSNSQNAEELNERIGFNRQDGIFKAFCVEAFNAAKKNGDKDKPKYVFIIDEINRGEISKIFGELFFSIDPGYRYLFDDKEQENNKRKVFTQYQNLIVDTKDPFKDGFFVPENVYLIGTMNDIDRSVESMDFAFRRRFTFVEITATDTQSMLDDKKAWKDNMPKPNVIAKIKEVMNALNDAIWNETTHSGIEGLSSSFHIGAAYFLKLKDGNFQKLWNYHLKGLLREYLRGIDEDGSKFKEIEDQYNKAAGIKQNE